MKKTQLIALAITGLAFFASCKKEDDENEITLNFKTGAGYTSSDQTLAKNSAFTVGVQASTEKKKDPLKKFNISHSVNSGASSSVYTEDLDTQDYQHDQALTLGDTVHGNVHTYVFTITNRDGVNQQKSLKITVQ